MESRLDGGVLWLRVVLLASVTVFLGVAGHATADGLLPGVGWLVLLLGLAVVLIAPFLAQPVSALRLVVLTVGGQAVTHVVLSATAGHAAPARAVAGHGGGAHWSRAEPVPGALPVVDGRRVGSLQDAWEAGAGTSSAGTPSLPLGHLVDHLTAHAPMMAAHLLAAVLVGLWLAVGERALWTLLALAAALVLRPLLLLRALSRAGLPVGRRPRPPHPAPPRPGPLHVLARSVVRRGPPLHAV